jgi:enolase
MSKDYHLLTRQVLLSTGEFTVEAVIQFNNTEFYDSAPLGLTVGFKEEQSDYIFSHKGCHSQVNLYQDISKLSQEEFDEFISNKCDKQTSVAFSLAFLKYLAYKNGFTEKQIYKFIARQYNKKTASPKIICNLLNGGRHSENSLAFCEFMVIPQGTDFNDDIQIVAQVYSDLIDIVVTKMGHYHLRIGREGGISPLISDVEIAIYLLNSAIQKRNNGKCLIAIDVAANSFAKIINENKYIYTINGNSYTTRLLLDYYTDLINRFPIIAYLEDPFHENDINGWKQITNQFGAKILIVADDLTVSTTLNLEKYQDCFNACILKVNQAGNVSKLITSYEFCLKNNIQTIVSQRSGETDSNIISHIATGLGSNYIKAGAPARERIVKYNELIRLNYKLSSK